MSRPYINKEFCYRLEEILDGLQQIRKDIDDVMNDSVTIRFRYVDILAKILDVLSSLRNAIDRHIAIIGDRLKDVCGDHSHEERGC